jgi:hypothetical protein
MIERHPASVAANGVEGLVSADPVERCENRAGAAAFSMPFGAFPDVGDESSPGRADLLPGKRSVTDALSMPPNRLAKPSSMDDGIRLRSFS